MHSNLNTTDSQVSHGLLSSVQAGNISSRRSPLRRAKVIQNLAVALRTHLCFSLEQVYTIDQQRPINSGGQIFHPDIWIATLAKNPVRSRTLVEPGVVVLVRVTSNIREHASLLRAYRQIDGVREILVLDLLSRSVEIFRREGLGNTGWTVEDFDDCSGAELRTVQFTLSSHFLWSNKMPSQSELFSEEGKSEATRDAFFCIGTKAE